MNLIRRKVTKFGSCAKIDYTKKFLRKMVYIVIILDE
ncbi:DUF2080 family transposase-associated protein [Ferroplasma acidiphilum]